MTRRIVVKAPLLKSVLASVTGLVPLMGDSGVWMVFEALSAQGGIVAQACGATAMP